MFAEISKSVVVENVAFRVLDFHTQSESSAKDMIGDLPAGYSQFVQVLFMDITQIHPRDWDILFIHELGHHLDKKMETYVREFNSLSVRERVKEITERYDKKLEVKKDDIQFLDEWLMNGMNIRLLSEWRVWSFTLDYISADQAIQYGPRTFWLKGLAGKDQVTRKIELFQFLDRNFINPTDQNFSHPLIKNRILFLREKVRTDMAKGIFPS